MNLRSSIISNESSFQFLGNSVNINNNNLHQNSFSILNDLTESLNRNLSESVFDFMKCFICLSKTNQPLSCPKCNNFACKKCLETYFNGQNSKACPLCKQVINFYEMKESKMIKEIEKVLNKDITKKQKLELLIELMKEKKNLWENESNNINSIIEKIFKYQDVLEDYKKEYNLFFINCQKVVEKTINDFSKKIEELINSLLAYNQLGIESIQKYEDINKNYQKDEFNNIKNIINGILSMERKHFNESNKNDIEKFLFISLKIFPSLTNIKIRDIKLKMEDIIKYSAINIKGNHYKFGEYKLKYSINLKNGLESFCEFSFTLKDNSNSCFLITQSQINKNNKQKLFPMKLTEKKDKKYNYECVIPFEESSNQEDISLIIEALVFTIN